MADSAATHDAAQLAAALDCIDTGVLVFDFGLRIRFANAAYLAMMGLEDNVCHVGANYVDVLWILADRGEYGAGEVWDIVETRLAPVRARQRIKRLRRRPNGLFLSVEGVPLPDGGYIYTFTDTTAEHLAAESLRAAGKATVLALADLAEFRDTDTGDHVVRVSRMVHEIARTMSRRGTLAVDDPDEFCSTIALASMLHDIGKVTIPDSILRKPGSLDADERALMQRHAAEGHMLLSKAAAIAPAGSYLGMSAVIARSHHERYDGTGYPDGLAGNAIPPAAAIAAVADVFDALVGERPYKQPWPEDRALAHIAEQAGRHFDPTVVDAFLEAMEERRQTPPLIRWEAAMSIGEPTLDRDHKNLIGLFNQLAHEANRNDRDMVQMVLDELAGYAVAHFRREEDYFQSRGVDLTGHRAQHRKLAEDLAGIRAAVACGQALPGREVHELLADWLRRHILEEDRGCFLESRRLNP